MVDFGNIAALERAMAAARRQTRLGRIIVCAAFALIGVATLFLLLRVLVTHSALAGNVRLAALMLIGRPPLPDSGPLYPDVPYSLPPAPRPIEPPPLSGGPGGPVLAIVIDDIGNNMVYPRKFVSLGVPLTFAILPGLPHTEETAALFDRAHLPYIIHLPMEPLDYPQTNPGPMPLLLGQSEEQTVRRLRDIMVSLPGAIGASNHMGSAYTADREKMSLVQSLLAERNMLFLNSVTANTTVPRAVAREGRYPFLERDVFLDNVRTVSAITREINQALRVARHRGQAIAIGHPYPETVQALREMFKDGRHGAVRLVSLAQIRRSFDDAAPNPEPPHHGLPPSDIDSQPLPPALEY